MSGKRKELVGKVVSTKMQKTIVVLVESIYSHPLYKKTVKKRKKYKAHDEKQIAREGDIVLIQETRPLSKEKRWRLVKIIKKAEITPSEVEELKTELEKEETLEEGEKNDTSPN
jgi:small subunit ribosomal protein S17